MGRHRLSSRLGDNLGINVVAGADVEIHLQIWFPGAHSDVGGGYEKRELADIPLFWMAVRPSLHSLFSLAILTRVATGRD